MEGTYDILLGSEPVGQAFVTRQGLYWHFDCRCRLTGEVICRLTVRCGGKTENLGIPVPAGGEFILRTRLPAKRLGEGEPQFRLVPKHSQPAGKFIPISPEEPFAYLSRLQDAFLERRDGQVGIVIRE